MRTFLICGRRRALSAEGVIAVVAAWLLILTASVLDQAALAQALGAIPYVPRRSKQNFFRLAIETLVPDAADLHPGRI